MRRSSPSVRNKRQLDAAGAVAAPLQGKLKPAGKPRDGAEHVLLARDRLGKTLLGDVRRDRQARIERLVLAAERAVELAQQFAAEAGGEGCARQIDDIADALQADARQRRDGLRRQPQRGERQRRKQSAFLAASVACGLAEMRGGPGRADACRRRRCGR